MKRLMDGQFSDCDLTLRDLGEIEQALLRTLAGIYHGRVAYPKPLQLSHGLVNPGWFFAFSHLI